MNISTVEPLSRVVVPKLGITQMKACKAKTLKHNVLEIYQHSTYGQSEHNNQLESDIDEVQQTHRQKLSAKER